MKKKIGTTVRAEGKINLYLDVLSRTADGYHTIESVMQSVSLCDRVTVSAMRGDGDIRIGCNLPYIPCDGRNIAYKAARALLCEAGIDAAVRIFLDKRIPVAGGMAGGSADAAAVLAATNRVLGSPLQPERLLEIGRTLGADVPFCMAGGTALCTGVGDETAPLVNRLALPLLIVPSRESVSTPWAYAELDRAYGGFAAPRTRDARLDRLTAALADGDAAGVCRNLYNIFEDVILPHRPQAARAKQLLTEGGALAAMMSGSGPTVFGIFADVPTRDAAARLLTRHGYRPKNAEFARGKSKKELIFPAQ